jgi:hypothetical protein
MTEQAQGNAKGGSQTATTTKTTTTSSNGAGGGNQGAPAEAGGDQSKTETTTETTTKPKPDPSQTPPPPPTFKISSQPILYAIEQTATGLKLTRINWSETQRILSVNGNIRNEASTSGGK